MILRLLHDLLFDYTLRTVALGSALLGLVSGTLGAFAVLRQQSLLGDAISHAALPGIVLAFMLTGAKAPLVLIVGAAIAGWVGTLLVMTIVSTTRVPEDSALGIVLSVFFGFGLVLLTFVQQEPDAAQAGLDRFLFGQAATLVESDVAVLAGLGTIALAAVWLLWKEFKLLSFDRDFGASLGFSMRRIDLLLTTFLVLAIVIGLQTVGVVLMSAMVVAPAAAARQWTDSLRTMVLVSALFGALAGLTGALASAVAQNVPTGPSVVLAATTLVLFSIGFAPRRGLLWNAVRQRRNRRRIRTDAVLLDLLLLAAQHGGAVHGHRAEVIEAMGVGRGGVRRTLQVLRERGLVQQLPDDTWALTPAGHTAAQALTHGRTTDRL